MELSQEINELTGALVKFQGKVNSIAKDSVNPFFKMKYASLTTIWEHIRKPLADAGLSVVQGAEPEMVDGHVVMCTTLFHTSGQYVTVYMPVRLVKDDPQGLGSAITYTRRYLLSSVLGLVADEDDDGESTKAEKAGEKEKAKPVPVSYKAIVEKQKEKGYSDENMAFIITKVLNASKLQDLKPEQKVELLTILEEGKHKDADKSGESTEDSPE